MRRKAFGGKWLGHIWTGPRTNEFKDAYGNVIKPHPAHVVFVAATAPLGDPDMEYWVIKNGGYFEVNGPGVAGDYGVVLSDLEAAKLLAINLARANDAGRRKITDAF